MKLSIVILQTNKPQDVTQCLAALSRAKLPAETEVIVLNNGGKLANNAVDPASYATLKNVRFADLPRGGYIDGNNCGYALSSGEYIATVNADITVHKETIELLLKHLEANPGVGIVAPRLIYPDGHEQDSARPFPNLLELVWRRITNPNGRTKPHTVFGDRDYEPVDWFVGAMFIMTRACLEKTGGHDTSFFLFMSDITLCRETWNLGMEVRLLRDAKATHNESRLSQGGPLRFITKWAGRKHLVDAIAYFWKYLFQPYPALSPSGR